MICSKLLKFYLSFLQHFLTTYITIRINITNDLTFQNMLTRNIIIIAPGIKGRLP